MYKSRTLASEAIKGGKVKLDGDNFKPAHVVKVGEKYTLSIGHTKKVIEVTALIGKRGSFEQAQKHYNDISPPPEKDDHLPSVFFRPNVKREKGLGRPTKKDRRDIFGFNDPD